MIKNGEILCEFFGVILTRKELKKNLLNIMTAYRDSRVGCVPIYNPVYSEGYIPSAEALYRDYLFRFEEMMAHVLMDNGLIATTFAPEINTEEDCAYGIFYGFCTNGKLEHDLIIPIQIEKFWIEMITRIKAVFPFITDTPRHHKIKMEEGRLMFWNPKIENMENYEHLI